jgi:hypothetical protein
MGQIDPRNVCLSDMGGFVMIGALAWRLKLLLGVKNGKHENPCLSTRRVEALRRRVFLHGSIPAPAFSGSGELNDFQFSGKLEAAL